MRCSATGVVSDFDGEATLVCDIDADEPHEYHRDNFQQKYWRDFLAEAGVLPVFPERELRAVA